MLDMKEEQFVNALREELRITQQSRSSYIKQKFTFVTTLLGVGALSLSPDANGIQTANILYIVPIIAVAFDLYILGEDFSVKRIGAFLGRQEAIGCEEEKKWEKWVSVNRDPFSVVAGPLLSAVVLFVCACLLWSNRKVGFLYFLWLAFVILALAGLHVHGRRLRRRLRESI